METIVKEYQVFTFDELSDEAKEKALQDYIENGLWYEWYDFVFEDAKEIGKLIGLEIKNIYFDGLERWNECSFDGSYSYEKGSLKAVKEYAPLDTDLHEIVSDLCELQRRYFYQIIATIKVWAGFYTRNNMSVWAGIDNRPGKYGEWDNLRKEIEPIFGRVADWIHGNIIREYEWITSEAYYQDHCEANGYRFLANGDMF